MGHLHPRRLNGTEKAEIWRRWRQGESLQTIGRALGWVTKCMHYVVAGAGGVPPRRRRRSRWALTGAEREEISRGLANGASLRAGESSPGASGVDGESGSPSAWRPPRVSCGRRRDARVGAHATPEGLSLGHAPCVARRRGGQTGARMGAAANRRSLPHRRQRRCLADWWLHSHRGRNVPGRQPAGPLASPPHCEGGPSSGMNACAGVG